MARRRKQHSTTRAHIPRGRNARKQMRSSLLANRIVFELYNAGQALSRNDLKKRLGPVIIHEAVLDEELRTLQHLGQIDSQKKNRFSVAQKADLVEATVEMNPAGFGFGTLLKSKTGARLPDKDPYISRSHAATARHGDRVLLRLSASSRQGKTEGEIVGIFERRQKTLVGYFQQKGSHDLVIPEDPRFSAALFIDKSTGRPDGELRDGDAVIVELDKIDPETSRSRGTIVEILGDPNRLDVQIRMVVEKHQLAHRFSSEAEAAANMMVAVPEAEARDDLRKILHFTIDGEDAKDFDDAIAVEKSRNGYRLYVSIADVSAFVKPDSRLDLEAYERGTSVYFPTTVIPMLPENISNNLCSLVADEDRLTVSAILDFNRDGILRKKRFVRSLIHSRMRFTYETVRQIVVDRNNAIRSAYKPFLTPLKWATELATVLQNNRITRGSITLTIAEPDIKLDPDGQVTAIDETQRSFANQIIEEFMLAANEAVAQTFAEQGRDFLYRIHEPPDPDKLKDFFSVSKTLGLNLPAGPANAQWYNRLLHQVKDTSQERIVNNLLLRTMQQARYSHENTGHFGLGAAFYTHFTSPIRRYPDLIVHRLLCRMIEPGPDKKNQSRKAGPYRSLQEAGQHLSERERNGVTAERDMADRLKCRFMEERLGDVFRAVISSISDTLFFVDLLDHLVSGAVLLSSLTDDYYIHDSRNHRLIGDVNCRVLQIGDIVDVVLVEVVRERGRIFFTLEDTMPQSRTSSTNQHK